MSEDEGLTIMFDEGFLSSSRRVLPVSQVAENVSVLTEQQIKQWNAHTLGDVITRVIGVYMDRYGTIGNYGAVGILGSDFRHVLIMIDGLEISTTSDRQASLEFIPVHIIDRVEVIKGPASSAWGSSLGGVINVITKNPGERPISGFAHASYGSYATYDTGAEIRGQVNRLGYYLYGNHAHTNGSRENTEFSGGNIHGKVIWDLGPSDSLSAAFGYSTFDEGSGAFNEEGIAVETASRFLYLSLKLDKRITEWLRSELKFKYASFDTTLDVLELGQRSLLDRQDFDEVNRGLSLLFLGEAGKHDFAAGFDYKKGKVVSSALAGGGGDLEQWAFFANGTVRVGPLNITPGIRYDDTSTNGNNTSPSLGLACRVSDSTVLKFYIAEGFSIPPLSTTLARTFIFTGNPDLEMERVTSYQGGIEFSPLQSVAAKVTAFLHNTRNTLVRVPAGSTTTEINSGKQRIQGFDAEIRASLPAGLFPYFAMAFIDSEDRETGMRIRGIAPRYLYNIGINYVRGSLKASLDGKYAWWDAPQEDGARYDSFIFDLNVTKTFKAAGFVTPELFLSVRNLFNNVQYAIPVIRNPKRVFEGGLRAYF
jgi:vitamin B12 transporter